MHRRLVRPGSLTPLLAFGANLRHERTARGLTQEQVADRAEIDMSYYGRLECADIDPGVRMVTRMARGLGISPAHARGDVCVCRRCRGHGHRLLRVATYQLGASTAPPWRSGGRGWTGLRWRSDLDGRGGQRQCGGVGPGQRGDGVAGGK